MTCYGCGKPCQAEQKCARCGFQNKAEWKDAGDCPGLPDKGCTDCAGQCWSGGNDSKEASANSECGGCGGESSCRSGCRSGGEVVDEEPDDEEYPFWWRDQNYWWQT